MQMVKSWAMVLAIAMAGDAGPAATADAEGERLSHINAGLRAWLQQIEADAPYLLVDRGAGELRLMHGRMVLRVAGLVADSLGVRPPVKTAIAAKLRRFRPSDPWSRVEAGPFDWERNLVEEASSESALFFANGLQIYASAVWRRSGVAGLELGPGDFRSLYNACEVGTALVVLPVDWRRTP